MAPKSAFNLEELENLVAQRFEEAQSSLANHRKNCVALCKLHTQASKVVKPGKNGKPTKLVGEDLFGDIFTDMVNRVMVVKKGSCADRVVKFVGGYVKFVNDKAVEERQKQEPNSSASAHMQEDEDTFISRFVSRLLQWLLQGFSAKNKLVRQRCVHLVSEMMSSIGEIDEETYNILRENVVERTVDKEPVIRAHAIIALSKLVGTEDPDELESGESTATELILDAMCYDSAVEVRRAALLNIPITPDSLPIILTRAKDADTITRKLIYSSVLSAKLDHPRRMTIAQREDIIKAGLGDREPAVRVAAGKMVTGWFDLVMRELEPPAEGERWTGDDGGVMRAFVKFLCLFDVVGPGEAIAVDAVLAVFTTRPGLTNVFVFSDEFWEELSPESAVLARIFVEYCHGQQNETRLEAAALPAVMAFAFRIQEAYNDLLTFLQENELLSMGDAEEENEEREEELAKMEVILSELLRIALKLDYMDELGRRKIFQVVKEMLAHPQLPPGLIDRCLDVLCEILLSEKELIRIVVEIIIELRDEDGAEVAFDDENDASRSDISSFRKEKSLRRAKEAHEMTAEERRQADLTDLRCLTLCIGMLERVNGTFEDNSTLEGVLSDLIVPAVKRKELALREKGLVSLGLCCLIAKNMALNSFQLFLSQVQSAPEELKVKMLQVVFDLLVMYDHEFLGRSEEVSHQIITFILQTLESEDSDLVQSVICVGVCKLLLSGQITDPRVLVSLLITYISPTTFENQDLRQCLAYFFPVYCYSSPENQKRMQSIFIKVFDLAVKVHEQLDDDQEMISLAQFGLLLVDWMDPNKLVKLPNVGYSNNANAHDELAVEILLALYDSDRDDMIRKELCQLLTHLQLSPKGMDPRTMIKLSILLEHLQTQYPLDDPALDKTFDKFKERFDKAYASQVEAISPATVLKDTEYRKLYEFIGLEVPDVEVPESEPEPEQEKEPEDEEELVQEVENKPMEDAEEEVEESSTPPPVTPLMQKRNLPEESPATSPEVQKVSVDPDEAIGSDEDSDVVRASPAVIVSPMKKGTKRAPPTPSKQTPASPVRKKRGASTRK
ncbi:hypothetical protein K435DRAFT_718742 [Dendrothele bispora CBS 962.96]|uniref:Nuclear condensin complex subunit 3 C-terminal domain-containing protein n=1 Tax=Dendrothele bispora (strain CBS 962.96) TaxID=1314807 RepID=A0A4S8MDT9_DENBC|nr:hypothetical protein K435DRAFT_718742 [Dendrothele bispora CBS 962.96]